MTATSCSPAGIAYSRAGPRADLPVVLIHAGIADRRTWDPLGRHDLDAIADTARRVSEEIPIARRVDWLDTAHLPSMERPDDFFALLRDWLAP